MPYETAISTYSGLHAELIFWETHVPWPLKHTQKHTEVESYGSKWLQTFWKIRCLLFRCWIIIWQGAAPNREELPLILSVTQVCDGWLSFRERYVTIAFNKCTLSDCAANRRTEDVTVHWLYWCSLIALFQSKTHRRTDKYGRRLYFITSKYQNWSGIQTFGSSSHLFSNKCHFYILLPCYLAFSMITFIAKNSYCDDWITGRIPVTKDLWQWKNWVNKLANSYNHQHTNIMQ